MKLLLGAVLGLAYGFVGSMWARMFNKIEPMTVGEMFLSIVFWPFFLVAVIAILLVTA